MVVRYGNYPPALRPTLMCTTHLRRAFFITNSYKMSYSKNYSPAPTKNERRNNINPVIDRVMRGERFRLTTDRFGLTYRFEREDSIHYTFYINDLLAGVTTQGAFLPIGFALTLGVLGQPTHFSVLRDDIRFVEEFAAINFVQEGGALC